MSRAPRFPLSRGNPRAEPDARGYDSRQYQQPQYQQPQYQQPQYQPQEPPRASGNDPLSELARLIGETKPFDEPRQPSRDHNTGWPGQPQQNYSAGLPPLMPEYRNDPPPPMPEVRYAPAPPPPPRYGNPYADPRQDHYEPPEYGHQPQSPYYGDDGRLMPQDPYESGHYDYDAPRPRRRSGLMITGVVTGLVLLGLGGAYTYRTMLGGGVSGPPPLIKADTTPSKIVPAQSGADGAAGKQIYDRVGSGATQDERVVSREEQPVDVRTAARPAAPSAGTLPQQSNSLMQPPGASQSNPVGSQNAPRPVKTIPIRPDMQGNTSPPQQRAAAAQPQSAPAPTQSTARTAASGNAPLSLTPGGGATVAARAPAPNSVDTSAASTSAPTGVGYMVQVSAQKTQGEATSAFKSAQAKYPNLLGTYQVVLRKKEIPSKGTFYGAQVGPFETKADADGLCAQLKSAGGNCLVEKN